MKKQNNWDEIPSGTLVLVRICGQLRRCVFDKIDYDGVYILVYNGNSFDVDCLSTSHKFIKYNWITGSITSNK